LYTREAGGPDNRRVSFRYSRRELDAPELLGFVCGCGEAVMVP
jgi:hypothetical protein